MNTIQNLIRNRLGLGILFVFVFIQEINYSLHSKFNNYSKKQRKEDFFFKYLT